MLKSRFESPVGLDDSMLDTGCWIMQLWSFIVRSSVVECNVMAADRLRKPICELGRRGSIGQEWALYGNIPSIPIANNSHMTGHNHRRRLLLDYIRRLEFL